MSQWFWASQHILSKCTLWDKWLVYAQEKYIREIYLLKITHFSASGELAECVSGGQDFIKRLAPVWIAVRVSSKPSICTPPPQETEKVRRKKSATCRNKSPLIPRWHERKPWHVECDTRTVSCFLLMMGVANRLDLQQNQSRSLLITVVQKAEAAPVQECYRLYLIIIYPALADDDVILESGPAVRQQSNAYIKSWTSTFVLISNL